MTKTAGLQRRRAGVLPADLRRSLALSHAGRHAEAMSVLGRAREAARKVQHLHLEAEILSMMSCQSFLVYDTSESLSLARTILELGGRRDATLNHALFFKGHLAVARTLGRLGHVAESREALVRAEGSCSIANAAELCNYLEARAMVEAKSGSAMGSLAAFERVLEISSRCDSIESYACRLTSAASGAAITGFIDEAFHYYECALTHTLLLPGASRLPAAILTEYAWTALSVGEFVTASTLMKQLRDTGVSACVRVFGAAVSFILTALGFGDAYAVGEPDFGAFALACTSGIPQRIGPIAAALHACFVRDGKTEAASDILASSMNLITSVDGCWWLLLAVATHGRREEIHKALALLALYGDGLKLARAHRLMLEARLANDDCSDDASERLAWEASQLFNELGWRYHRALSLRLAGRHALARDLLLKMGVRQSTNAAGTPGRHRPRSAHHLALTSLDDEIIRLVFQNWTARDIGATLGMSERAVKYHLTEIFATFGVRNRRELAACLFERLRDPISRQSLLSKL